MSKEIPADIHVENTDSGEITLAEVRFFEVKKTQISFVNRHLFGAVSFTPVRRAKERPDPYITVTFGLSYQIDSPRIDAAVEAYPHRFTHHLIIGSVDEIDGELLGWLREAADFACSKR